MQLLLRFKDKQQMHLHIYTASFNSHWI